MNKPSVDRSEQATAVAIAPRLLNKADAGKYLGVSRRTITRLVLNGEIEARTIGQLVVIPIAALDAFAETLPRAKESGAP
jgi:excisionase family DNA binding protein